VSIVKKSNLSAASRKASNQNGWKAPYEGFPLSYHPPSGRLYKKIKGKRYYFGYASDWQVATDKFQAEQDDLYAGRTPRATSDGLTVKDLLNRFLTVKQQAVDTGELTNRSFVDYKRVTDRIFASFGGSRLASDLSSDDFEKLKAEIAKTGGLTYLGGEINRIRVVFNYAWEAGLIDSPVRYGPTFKRPSKKSVRKEKRKSGSKMFERDDLIRILDAAGVQMRAMILLGCNGGLGNSDTGQLNMEDVDLDAGLIDYPRPKTGIERRVPLWAETIEAIKASLAVRTEPKDEVNADLVFVTKRGGPWHVDDPRSPLSHEFRKLMQRIDHEAEVEAAKNGTEPPDKLYVARRGFYALRHTFRTIADESRDFPAIDRVMGHSDNTMGGHYRERINDDRLRAVVNHVRDWLYADHGGDGKEPVDETNLHSNFRIVG
jgi:integrase